MAAGAAMLLAPAPAHAEFVCWMSDGIRYCYDPNDRQVPAEPEPVPVEEPTYIPTPPAASVEQPWIQPVPAQPAPVQPVPAPVNPVPVPPPALSNQVPVPVYVPPQPGYVPAAEGTEAIVEAPAQAVPEVIAVQTAPAEAGTDAIHTPSASPTAAASPSSSAPVAASVTSGQAASTQPVNPPLVITTAGVLLTVALVWFAVPVRTVLARLMGAK
ncbi:hypothetical protein DXK94_18035 [Arthrobacter sp. RT-1]|nr:hypothetical protein DXK94_18035 [Arthrobacter sp. RT-1]